MLVFQQLFRFLKRAVPLIVDEMFIDAKILDEASVDDMSVP
jgi:hypothetical protein